MRRQHCHECRCKSDRCDDGNDVEATAMRHTSAMHVVMATTTDAAYAVRTRHAAASPLSASSRGDRMRCVRWREHAHALYALLLLLTVALHGSVLHDDSALSTVTTSTHAPSPLQQLATFGALRDEAEARQLDWGSLSILQPTRAASGRAAGIASAAPCRHVAHDRHGRTLSCHACRDDTARASWQRHTQQRQPQQQWRCDGGSVAWCRTLRSALLLLPSPTLLQWHNDDVANAHQRELPPSLPSLQQQQQPHFCYACRAAWRGSGASLARGDSAMSSLQAQRQPQRLLPASSLSFFVCVTHRADDVPTHSEQAARTHSGSDGDNDENASPTRTRHRRHRRTRRRSQRQPRGSDSDSSAVVTSSSPSSAHDDDGRATAVSTYAAAAAALDGCAVIADDVTSLHARHSRRDGVCGYDSSSNSNNNNGRCRIVDTTPSRSRVPQPSSRLSSPSSLLSRDTNTAMTVRTSGASPPPSSRTRARHGDGDVHTRQQQQRRRRRRRRDRDATAHVIHTTAAAATAATTAVATTRTTTTRLRSSASVHDATTTTTAASVAMTATPVRTSRVDDGDSGDGVWSRRWREVDALSVARCSGDDAFVQYTHRCLSRTTQPMWPTVYQCALSASLQTLTSLEAALLSRPRTGVLSSSLSSSSCAWTYAHCGCAHTTVRARCVRCRRTDTAPYVKLFVGHLVRDDERDDDYYDSDDNNNDVGSNDEVTRADAVVASSSAAAVVTTTTMRGGWRSAVLLLRLLRMTHRSVVVHRIDVHSRHRAHGSDACASLYVGVADASVLTAQLHRCVLFDRCAQTRQLYAHYVHSSQQAWLQQLTAQRVVQPSRARYLPAATLTVEVATSMA